LTEEGTGPVVKKGLRGIAATRRILVVTAEFSVKGDTQPGQVRDAMLEIALLTVMVVALVGSLLMLRSKSRSKSELAAGR